jgi:hypothetical protein
VVIAFFGFIGLKYKELRIAPLKMASSTNVLFSRLIVVLQMAAMEDNRNKGLSQESLTDDHDLSPMPP